MTKKRILLWLIPTLILLMLVPFIVPSAIPYAGAVGDAGAGRPLDGLLDAFSVDCVDGLVDLISIKTHTQCDLGIYP